MNGKAKTTVFLYGSAQKLSTASASPLFPKPIKSWVSPTHPQACLEDLNAPLTQNRTPMACFLMVPSFMYFPRSGTSHVRGKALS